MDLLVGIPRRSKAVNVLIVDDSSVMRKLVRRGLRQAGFEGHDYEEAEDGAEALEKIRGGTVDVALVDWNMPNMTGIEMLEALQGDDVKVKVGFVTSESTPEMRARASTAGAAFFITKPFTPDSLQAALSSTLD